VVSIPYAVPKAGSLEFARALARSWASPYPVDLWKWRVRAVERAVSACLREQPPDVIVSDFLFAFANVTHARVPLVYFAHNVEYLIWKRLCAIERRPWRRALLEIEWRKLRRCEYRACRRARATIAVSDADRDRLHEGAPDATIVSIPTGVDVEYFRPRGTPQIPGRLVFSGSMDWYPNEDAMTHFVNVILPIIRRTIPHVSLTIVGRNPSPAVQALTRHEGVQVTGTVEDVRPYLDEAEVYVVPLRVGGGTRLKIFEALAMGKAVASTTIGAEGLDLASDQQIALADDPDAFAQRVIGLLRDAAWRSALGDEGRRLVETRYSWDVIARAFENHLLEARDDDDYVAADRRRGSGRVAVNLDASGRPGDHPPVLGTRLARGSAGDSAERHCRVHRCARLSRLLQDRTGGPGRRVAA
jgi:glycosyltransferase involved in cell wall biosynthesis